MDCLQIIGRNLSKAYSPGKNIFKDIDFSINASEIFGIAGRNGSGKTTLLKIIAGVLSPTKGSISISCIGEEIPKREYFGKIAFVAPYLSLYEEFNPLEHLSLVERIRGRTYNRDIVATLFEKLQLEKKKSQRISEFSSGMKQRFRYILAIASETPVLLADEAFTNLDSDGIDTVKTLFQCHSESGGIIVLASNEPTELELCGKIIDLNVIAGAIK